MKRQEKERRDNNIFVFLMLDGMHFRAASRDAGGRLRAHRDVRSETGRPSNAVKSARVKRLRAGNLFSDAYTGGFMETNLLTGGRNPSQLYHRDRKQTIASALNPNSAAPPNEFKSTE
ncbi:hypothetical protein AT03_00020 [Hafnia alvei FB1]|uniref:Uncharacterized protein n=1 Tax=Hafnia alvei FB1 TaxID=1453496 RepID=A0A097QWS9_HAFAL|nr:hypothetical protein [Hafnia alvei]AIU70945.1 hypothetical protein AT03_00020 [Hafnia alvei FB1]